jgi:hypothetical protein
LPFADASVDLVVGLNAVPDAASFARVLRRDGAVLWASSFGEDTPLYVAPEAFLASFGDGWSGVAGRAGHGDWVLVRRGR